MGFERVCWTAAGRALARMLTEAVFAAEPEEISFLSFLWYVHGGGGPFRIADVDNGAQERKLAGGTMALSEGLRARFDALPHGATRLSSAVAALAQVCTQV